MQEQLKRVITFLAAIMFSQMMFNCQTTADGSPPGVGGVLAKKSLPAPKNPYERHYLGIRGGTFMIPEIKAQVVVIEFFSFYCPVCQREAPKVNKLYYAVEKNQLLKGKVKLIGIGLTNSSFEVEAFKKNYNIPFPLFSDADRRALKSFGVEVTPYFVVIKINDDGSHQVVYSKSGSIKEPDQFLKLITKLSGLQSGGGK